MRFRRDGIERVGVFQVLEVPRESLVYLVQRCEV